MLMQLDSFDTSPSYIKLPLVMIGSLAMTFSLFALMQYLIKTPAVGPTELKPMIDVSVYEVRQLSEVKIKTKIKPPPKMTTPPKRNVASPSDQVATNAFVFSPMVDVTIDNIPNSAPGLIAQDGQASPIVRVPPKYPVSAARDGVEGWVELNFSIDETGRVIDAKVVQAEPKRLFNKAALNAIKRWKYKPTIDGGTAKVQRGQSVVLEFKLDQG